MKTILPFGKYLLLERISVGGMAEVFKARAVDDPTGRLIAIKRILPSMAEDADFISMFIDEARITGQLNHAHIAQIYELSQVGDSHFIAMEFVWGKDVLQIQNRFRRLKSVMPFRMAAFIAGRIAQALDYAHRKNGPDGLPLGIIHRDVSPQNVLVSYQGDVKVIDFGIAKAASRSTKTQAGVLKGKFGYMSPEQVGGELLDRRSDVFAIGTILYELITADRLFVGESDFATLERVRSVDVRAPVDAVPDCPPEIDRIIRKALARSTSERYQWASEMAADLAAWLEGEPPFGAADLAAWMQEHFTTEMKREAHALEEQRRAAADFLDMRSAIPVPVPVPLALVVGGAPVAAARASSNFGVHAEDMARERMVPSATADLSAESTHIVTPDLPSPALSAAATMIVDAGRASSLMAAAAAQAGGPLEAASTRILLPGEVVPAGLAAGVADEIPAQATAILEAPSIRVPPAPPMVIAPTPPPLYVAPVPGYSPRAQLEPHPSTGRVDSPPSHRTPRSTLWKDVLTGVAVAGVVLAGAVGYLYYRDHAAGPNGTLVVTVSPATAATVLIDGQPRGTIDPGRALTLKDVASGRHYVEVRSGTQQFAESVVLAGGDVTVVSAVLPVSERPPAVERSAVALATAVGTAPGTAPVFAARATDGAPRGAHAVAAGTGTGTGTGTGEGGAAPVVAAAPTIPPAAEKPSAAGAPREETAGDQKPAADHPRRDDAPATGGGEEPTADPGTTTTRATARGHLVVKTDPPGAEVLLAGRSVGVTPIDLADVEGGRDVRVQIRRRGYATVARHLDFEKEPDRILDVKLVAMVAGAGGPAEGGTGKGAEPASPASGAIAAVPDVGFLVANTQPWARVFIDGKDTGKSTPIAPLSKITLKPGPHTVTFTVEGKKWTFPIDVKAGEVTRLIKTLGDDGH